MAAGLSELTALPSPEWSFSHWVPQLKITSHLEWILFLKIAARDKFVHILKLQPTPPVNINKSYANIWGHESPELIFICCWTSPGTNFRCSMWGNLTKGNKELCILVQRPFSFMASLPTFSKLIHSMKAWTNSSQTFFWLGNPLEDIFPYRTLTLSLIFIKHYYQEPTTSFIYSYCLNILHNAISLKIKRKHFKYNHKLLFWYKIVGLVWFYFKNCFKFYFWDFSQTP